MKLITKNEKNYLEKKGYRFGDMLHKTYTSHPKYYATEDPKLIKDLEEYRASIVKKNFK